MHVEIWWYWLQIYLNWAEVLTLIWVFINANSLQILNTHSNIDEHVQTIANIRRWTTWQLLKSEAKTSWSSPGGWLQHRFKRHLQHVSGWDRGQIKVKPKHLKRSLMAGWSIGHRSRLLHVNKWDLFFDQKYMSNTFSSKFVSLILDIFAYYTDSNVNSSSNLLILVTSWNCSSTITTVQPLAPTDVKLQDVSIWSDIFRFYDFAEPSVIVYCSVYNAFDSRPLRIDLKQTKHIVSSR